MTSSSNERNRQWYARNVEAQRARVKATKERQKREDPEGVRLKRNAWIATPAGKEALRRCRFKKKYGITIEQWKAMLREQDGRCAVCRTSDPGPRGFFVDHDHKAKKVRGLLCHRCNTGIGYLLDNPLVLRLAARYVEKHSQRSFFDSVTR